PVETSWRRPPYGSFIRSASFFCSCRRRISAVIFLMRSIRSSSDVTRNVLGTLKRSQDALKAVAARLPSEPPSGDRLTESPNTKRQMLVGLRIRHNSLARLLGLGHDQ